MTLYLTDDTSADEIARAKECGFVCRVTLYQAVATTNTVSGVRDLRLCSRTLETMQALS